MFARADKGMNVDPQVNQPREERTSAVADSGWEVVGRQESLAPVHHDSKGMAKEKAKKRAWWCFG